MTLLYSFPTGETLWLQPAPPPAPPTDADAPALPLGPQLFLDNWILETTGGTGRKLRSPVRALAGPLLSSPGFYTGGQVVRDAATGRWRVWYSDKATDGMLTGWMRESADGLTWGAAGRLAGLDLPGVVLDLGPGRLWRYQTLIRHVTPAFPRWPADLFASADGITWFDGSSNPVIAGEYGEVYSLAADGDGFRVMHRHNLTDFSWHDSAGVLHAPPFTRTLAVTASPDGLSYPPSKLVFTPDAGDAGETHIYSCSNLLRRGGLWIALLHLYRADLTATGSAPGMVGTGYTALAWSRDGVTWDRWREPYFAPTPAPGWDHAITWINSLVLTGDSLALYYLGLQAGHVGGGRGLGRLNIKRDRFVSRTAWADPQRMRTKAFRLPADFVGLTINARGSVRVQVLDAAGVPWAGFAFADHVAGSADSTDRPVKFGGALAGLVGRVVRLEFELTNADLYGFELK